MKNDLQLLRTAPVAIAIQQVHYKYCLFTLSLGFYMYCTYINFYI